MSTLLVVTGPPGAGKSTVSGLLVSRFDLCALVPGDDFFALIASGRIDPWLPAAHRQNGAVIRAAAAAAGRLALSGYTVLYDGVLGPWFIGDFMLEAGLDAIHYASLMPTEETCLQRVSTRTAHGFTDLAAASHMYREFENSPLDVRHVVPDHGSASETADEVMKRLDAGDLEWKVSDT